MYHIPLVEDDGIVREFRQDALAELKMGTVFGVTETVPKRAALAFFTARARPAVRAMPRVNIIETRLKYK